MQKYPDLCFIILSKYQFTYLHWVQTAADSTKCEINKNGEKIQDDKNLKKFRIRKYEGYIIYISESAITGVFFCICKYQQQY